MRNGFTVKSGFELHVVFGIVGLEHFVLLCVNTSGQLRRCFFSGKFSFLRG